MQASLQHTFTPARVVTHLLTENSPCSRYCLEYQPLSTPCGPPTTLKLPKNLEEMQSWACHRQTHQEHGAGATHQQDAVETQQSS